MEMEIIKKIKGKVEDFKKLINDPELQFSEPYYLYKEYKEDPDQVKQWPSSDSPGVYIFISDDKILYIGMSTGYMGNRIWSHTGRLGKKSVSEEEYPNAEDWIKKNKADICFITIAFLKDRFWLAPALESFLIDQFKDQPTLNNKLGRH